MSEEFRPRLFQKFTQADGSITRRFGGTGLGLSICKQLAEMMGGDVGVEPRSGNGSDFWFTVRLEPAVGAVIAAVEDVADLQGMRALIVDDVETNRSLLERQLDGMDLRLTCEEDGFAAFAELERAWHRGDPYGLLLLDQMMPGMAGETLARRVRADARFAAVRIVLISSMPVPEKLKHEEPALFDEMLLKPLRRQVLVATLARVCSGGGEALAESSFGGVPTALLSPPEEPAVADRCRILLAEDNPVNRQIAVTLLERAGYAVDIACDGGRSGGGHRRTALRPRADGHADAAHGRRRGGALHSCAGAAGLRDADRRADRERDERGPREISRCRAR